MEIILGPARKKALIHTANVLGYGNFLCQCVKARVDFDGGDFYSFDPVGRDIDQVENFSWGSGAGHDDVIAKRLFSSLTVCPRRILVMDDVMGDASIHEINSAINNGQIYHWIASSSAKEGDLNRLVWATSVSWHFLAVIFSGGGEVRAGECISSGRCEELGQIVEVIFGAYDGEGFIHWIPN